ncbi:MAG: RsmE family RNA methyltransferase [candidate division Zixibacteria bacterium]
MVAPSQVDDDRLVLGGDEAKHLKKVLRAKIGDTFYAIDGTGLKYRVVIDSLSGANVKGIISNITRLENEPYHDICLAMGVCRPAKMDHIVEKCTEIGVSSFEFYYSEKSYSKIKKNLSSTRKVSRLRRIITAAAKQSKRSILPSVAEFKTYSEIVALSDKFDLSLAAVCRDSAKPIEKVIDKSGNSKKILLLVGPESGFSDDEIETASNAGFKTVSLGPRRLRAETAGIIFPTIVLNHLGDL